MSESNKDIPEENNLTSNTTEPDQANNPTSSPVNCSNNGTIPGEYQTGVSNGDVDWLFRGKSKKLTKKMAQPSSQNPQQPQKPQKSVETKTNPSEVITPRQATKESPPPTPAKTKKPEPAVANTKQISPESSPTANKPPVQEKVSKLDKFKFGRSRSVSASAAQPPTAVSLGKRRSSTTTLNTDPESSSAIEEGNRSNGSSVSSSPNLSRSNSTSKRSIFSSLSSKFKTAPSPSTSTAPASVNAAAANLQKVTSSFLGGSSEDYIVSKSQESLPPRPRSVSRSSISSSKETVKARRTSENSEEIRQVLNKNKNRQSLPIKKLDEISIKRVTFAVDKLTYDPQQQIPSRRPKKGNVLVPEDLVAPPPRLSLGISLNEGAKVTQPCQSKVTEKDLNFAIETRRKNLMKAEKYALEAHLAAKRIALELSKTSSTASSISSKKSKDEEDEDAEIADEPIAEGKTIEIDNPLHLHENHFNEEHNEESSLDSETEVSLETVYTRCCHLREILPIPATLKQLKNKTRPLQVLKLLNPKPTLIDVLSFSDFIAITPINTIILDNVIISSEMLKHFTGSLQNNSSLEKLSLRNVAIDDTGWSYLCKLLTTNLNIKKLDVSQQRIKADTKPSHIRSALNWNLFIDALVLRGGIEELVINGCKLSDQVFSDLMEKAVIKNTYRLGVASTELNVFKAQKVADWIINENSKCIGVDLAFNDLSNGKLIPFIKAFNKGTKEAKLVFFSLNSTNLSNTEEAGELILALSKFQSLRFLDLSSLPAIFPNIISKLSEYLPNFPNLKRIHFDFNDLSVQAIRAIAGILPKVPGLFHVSLLGNRNLNDNSAGSLYGAVKFSNSIFALDLDYDLIPDDLSQRIAFYLMRNMDHLMAADNSSGGYFSHHTGDHDELMFDGSLLMQTAEKLLIENEAHNKKEDVKIQKFIAEALIERTRVVRMDIHRTIDTLFNKRNQGTLSLEGKETLLRFCVLDSTLEKLVHMFEEQARDISDPTDKDNTAKEDTSNTNDKPSKSLLSLPQVQLHQSSNELIAAGPILSPQNTEKFKHGYFGGLEPTQPHSVVIDSSSDGQSVPIDDSTGRPVLMRSTSHTSVHAKEQEQEEGEFHRLGFLIQQRNNSQNQLTPESSVDASKPKPRDIPLLQLPSGSELRDAIIAAKGIESVTELIEKINTNRVVSLEKIYDVPIGPSNEQDCREKTDSVPAPKKDSDSASIDSFEDAREDVEAGQNEHVTAVVDEAYDKLLNDAQRVRSKGNETV